MKKSKIISILVILVVMFSTTACSSLRCHICNDNVVRKVYDADVKYRVCKECYDALNDIDEPYLIDSIKSTSYANLSDYEKKVISRWVDDRFELYDELANQYTYDFYTDTIFYEAAKLFKKDSSQIEAIWMEE